MIQVIKKMSDIKNIQALINMIEKQMIKHNHDFNPSYILPSLKNALSKTSRAVLFLYTSEQEIYQGFAFGNISSGLETGGDYFWINELFIDELYRHQNLGSQLIEFIEDWCKAHQLKYILCITENENLTAKAFYKKQGFDLSGVTWVSKKVFIKK